MKACFLIVIGMALVACDEQVIPLDLIDTDASAHCSGQIDDAGDCIDSVKVDSERREHDDINDVGEGGDGVGEMDGSDRENYNDACEVLADWLAHCINELGAENADCLNVKRRYDEQCVKVH